MNKVFALSISCVIALFCVNVVFSDVSHLNQQAPAPGILCRYSHFNWKIQKQIIKFVNLILKASFHFQTLLALPKN